MDVPRYALRVYGESVEPDLTVHSKHPVCYPHNAVLNFLSLGAYNVNLSPPKARERAMNISNALDQKSSKFLLSKGITSSGFTSF